MESVDVMAGADAATSGQPLIEVIDEGQADLSSDEIKSFKDSSSSSSLPPIFSDPPPDFADAMDESDSPPKDTSSPPSLPPPSGQVGSCYEGQVLLYRPSSPLVTSWVELEGRYLMAEFNRRDSVFRIASVYAPNWNPERDEFFTSCLDFVDPSVPTILCGDFNAVFDRAEDRRGSDPAVTVRESFVSLELLLWEFCVLDVWRHLHPDLHAYTWLKPDGSLSSRIDLIGFPSIWVHLVSSCTIVLCPFFYHDAVFLGFSIPESFPRGRGRWKLNVSILKDPVFFQTVSDCWPRWRLRKPSFSSLQLWWDRGKDHLKSLAVRHCSGAHNERSLSRSVLSASSEG